MTRRPYFFEIFALLNLAAIALWAFESLPLVGGPLRACGVLFLSMTVQAALGVAVRSVVALVRGERAYFRVLASREWLADTVRVLTGFALIIFTYGWIKLVVPVYHPTLFDQELWNLDRMFFLGFDPTVFFLDLFGGQPVLRAVDWLYSNIFFASLMIAGAYFLSHPSRRIRVAFANGYAVLWLTGSWLYMLIPSLGPAYRFPEIWLAHDQSLRMTQHMQALLMRNYQNVLRAASGEPAVVQLPFGIGAFPSLHVAFQTYVFLWMRRLWTPGQVLFGSFVLIIFLGSMITGWHYLVDGLAGLLLAMACYRIFSRRVRIRRWVELRGIRPGFPSQDANNPNQPR